jgi:prepilin-type N-terminal cleavage/methylation domain-containing protein
VLVKRRSAFTLIELLVVIAILATLSAVLLPSLAGARGASRAMSCLSNQRQIAIGWTLYANNHQDRAMPLGDERSNQRLIYWWGSLEMQGSQTSNGASSGVATPMVDATRGFLMPYLDASLAAKSVLECPAQPWGSYRAQPMSFTPAQPTSTYGYNGYFLAPASTPGWNQQIGTQHWQRLSDLAHPDSLFVFADAMLGGSTPRNCALLDPPMLFSRSSGWSANPAPTTSFRHDAGATIAARADGSVARIEGKVEWYSDRAWRIGSVSTSNAPAYVPDWETWR